MGGKTKGFIKTKSFSEDKGGVWVYEAYSLSEDKGGVWVYEAYEVKNKREKLRCLLLRFCF